MNLWAKLVRFRPQFQIASECETCVWVALFLMAPQTQGDSASAIAAKHAFKKCAKLVSWKGAEASFVQQTIIGQRIEVNGLPYVRHAFLCVNYALKFMSGNTRSHCTRSKRGLIDHLCGVPNVLIGVLWCT